MEAREYLDGAGRSPFARWFEGLDPLAAAKVTAAVARLCAGNLSNVKSVGAGVHESRIDSGPGYRVYFAWEGRTIVLLLGGGTKKRQRRDIEDAARRWADHKARRRHGG
ncbi:MAG: type II toxin-antitoxin system RelE/ParE family toxin [Alphaproteobacteria bacterium]|nr:type II toxin-antitoxin system RelE/ParE family toxin [Alphaproteobacteria bacterium]